MKQKCLICFVHLYMWAMHSIAQPPAMVLVEGGTFNMGGITGNEKPIHSVTVSSFNMGKYEVTVEEYKAFCTAIGRKMPDPPMWGWNDKHPMVNVSFDDCYFYCKWLSKTTGKNYRLPTEAEWEYAARGGNKTREYLHAGSDDLEEVGWSKENAGRQTQACGRKKPNELGLYDMSGNVWEWCVDGYSDSFYKNSPSVNPIGPVSSSDRILRGGSWYDAAAYCRVANRNRSTRDEGTSYYGFRMVVPQ